MKQPIAKIAFPVILVLHLGVKVCFPGVFSFEAEESTESLFAQDLMMQSEPFQYQTASGEEVYGPTAVLVRRESK